MSTIVRAFLSIDIEDQSLLSQIQNIQQKLDLNAAKMKIVKKENIHFTLHFFGDTLLTKLDQIQACLDGIVIDPFEIEVVGVGSFPNKRRPRIIWIGVTHNASKILNLKNEIDSSLMELGYQPEKRKYTPHATIARVRHVNDSKRIADNLESLANEVIGSMIITKIMMMKSTLTSSGPFYEPLWQIG
ncbi:MAG: RNA 2',3'-cyclic phosphodiesterase [Candidatus Thorarchaeota archaeon]|nr:RNA 2',3'-cyclic phosphodiesterase [Candidatus Thorarchaeota archaeon]